MKDAGYQYVILDDCWQVAVSATNTGRDPQGNILVDTAKFPTGIKLRTTPASSMPSPARPDRTKTKLCM
jgi:hypothetical protein